MRVQLCYHAICCYNKESRCSRPTIVIGEAGECAYSTLLNLLHLAREITDDAEEAADSDPNENSPR